MAAAEHSSLAEQLRFLGDRLLEDHPMAPLCTYRVGGRARWFARLDDADRLAALGRVLGSVPPTRRPEVLVIGRGSNLLVADAGFDGLVVQLGAGFEHVEVLDRGGTGGTGVLVRAGGAASLPVVARRTVSLGLVGFEWAVGVPGSIGGAVRMNAGGHGADMARNLVGVRVVDLATGEDGHMHADQLDLGYRRSSIGPSQVVVHADLLLEPSSSGTGEQQLSEIVRWRREHQPGGQNAGSVFTNPPGDSAGRLIDEAGCKGLRIGTAQVSDKHANFIQADAQGSADDVLALMDEVVRRVEAHSGVRLHAETVTVGFPGRSGAPGASA